VGHDELGGSGQLAAGRSVPGRTEGQEGDERRDEREAGGDGDAVGVAGGERVGGVAAFCERVLLTAGEDGADDRDAE
jgi:hypothetical protein